MAIPLHGSWLMSALAGPDETTSPRWRRGASKAATPHEEAFSASRDAALVARLRAGEAAAFTELLEDVVPALVEYAGRLVPRGVDAEDLVQDVLARVWIARSTLAVATSVRAYLFVAVRNAAHNARKHQRVVVAYGEDARLYTEGSALDLATVLVGRVTVEQLLAHLSERRREALMLRYLGGLSFAEVAQVLGTTRVNAERLVARALETLRRLASGETPQGSFFVECVVVGVWTTSLPIRSSPQTLPRSTGRSRRPCVRHGSQPRKRQSGTPPSKPGRRSWKMPASGLLRCLCASCGGAGGMACRARLWSRREPRRHRVAGGTWRHVA